jgi:hypothetical protein
MKDTWIENHLEKNPDLRAKLSIIALIVQLSALFAMFIGGVILILHLLEIL